MAKYLLRDAAEEYGIGVRRGKDGIRKIMYENGMRFMGLPY